MLTRVEHGETGLWSVEVSRTLGRLGWVVLVIGHQNDFVAAEQAKSKIPKVCDNNWKVVQPAVDQMRGAWDNVGESPFFAGIAENDENCRAFRLVLSPCLFSYSYHSLSRP